MALTADDALAGPSDGSLSTAPPGTPPPSRPSQRQLAALADVADATAADLDSVCATLCQPTLLSDYPSSIKVLLKELRQKSDELRQMRFELEATQKLLYSSQEKVDAVQEAKWKEMSVVTVACAGLAAGLRSYIGVTVAKIETEKKRALVNVGVEVQERLEGAVQGRVEERVATRLKDAVAAEIPETLESLRQAQAAQQVVQQALKKERGEKAQAVARVQEISRQHGFTKFQLYETKRTLAEEQEAARRDALDRRLARVIIEARQAASMERALQRVKHEAEAAAERELALQRIVIEAQERRGEQLRTEAEEHRAEAARLQKALEGMAGREQAQLDVLRARADQAAALRAAADADYRDVSSQLQTERFRVETLQKQADAAAAERSAQGAAAGQLYQQLADQLEAEHERVSSLEAQLEAAARQRSALTTAYREAAEELQTERSRADRLQDDLKLARSELAHSVHAMPAPPEDKKGKKKRGRKARAAGAVTTAAAVPRPQAQPVLELSGELELPLAVPQASQLAVGQPSDAAPEAEETIAEQQQAEQQDTISSLPEESAVIEQAAGAHGVADSAAATDAGEVPAIAAQHTGSDSALAEHVATVHPAPVETVVEVAEVALEPAEAAEQLAEGAEDAELALDEPVLQSDSTARLVASEAASDAAVVDQPFDLADALQKQDAVVAVSGTILENIGAVHPTAAAEAQPEAEVVSAAEEAAEQVAELDVATEPTVEAEAVAATEPSEPALPPVEADMAVAVEEAVEKLAELAADLEAVPTAVAAAKQAAEAALEAVHAAAQDEESLPLTADDQQTEDQADWERAPIEQQAAFDLWEMHHNNVVPHRAPPARVWTDARFTAQTLAAFPDQAVASVEEARCLIERGGYVYLDVRPAWEVQEAGCVQGCVNVPVAVVEWADVDGRMQIVRKPHEGFVDEVARNFPRDTPLVVGCSDGCTYSVDALETLEEAGYTCLVGLKGGYYAWRSVFDAQGNRTSALPDNAQLAGA